jgi:hypothetical protein
MAKIISKKQLAANRRNAQRSTGPTSKEGKSVSRLNAVKHGLLAQQVVVHGYFHEESDAKFKQLCREHHESLSPIGPLEEMLVGQIIMVVWRLRRVRTAEAGEIATSVDKTWWNPRRPPWEIGNGHKGNALHSRLKDYRRSIEGIEWVIECLQELRGKIETAGQVTEEQLKELRHYHPAPNDIVRELAALFDSFKSNPKKLPPEKLRSLHLSETLSYLDAQISEFEELKTVRQEQMNVEDAMRRSVAMLPSGEFLEKIVRYESALQRQLNRSMNQLERLQRRRLGENVPAPVVMDVSMKG